jgi:hypothetical protein
MPSVLEEADTNLVGIKGLVSDAEGLLYDFSAGLDIIVFSVSSMNFSIIEETVNSTLESINLMLNETGETLDSVTNLLNETEVTLNETVIMLYDNAEMMELFANSSGIQLIAPEIAQEAENMAQTMKTTADSIANIPIKPTTEFLKMIPIESSIEDIEEFQPILSIMLDLLEILRLEIENILTNVSNYLQDLTLNVSSSKNSIDTISTSIANVKDQMWMVQPVVYGIIGYWIVLHTAFLIIGLIFRRED